jgi:hypothetical protein
LHNKRLRNTFAASEDRRRNTGEPQRTWHHLDSLPADIVTYTRAGLAAHTHQNAFSLDGW